MFDRIAPTYDTLNRLMSARIDVAWRKRAIEALAAGPAGAIVDLCAGTLDVTALLAKRFPERRLVATDFSPKMLDRGRTKAPTAEVLVADAMALPFADGEFASAICAFGVRNLSDPARGAEEAFRILTPGGLYVVLEFFRPSALVTRVFHTLYGKVVLPTVGGMISGDRGAYAYLSESMGAFLSRTEFETVLRKAGFVDVRGEELTFGVASLVVARKPA
jgi:ubiquinone/menaquinone biosynthesis methyltransferase